MKLDSLDKSILYVLGEDARITYKELARKINSKKPTVAYRVQRLIEEGVIWKFVPVVSIRRLGLHGYKLYARLQGLDQQAKKQLFEDLTNNPAINWVAETTGAWDLMWSVIAPSIADFAEQKDAFLASCGPYVQDYAVTILEDALVFNRDYLVEQKPTYRKEFIFGGEPEVVHLEDTKKRLLKAIMNDGRYQVTKLADKLNLNVRTVMAHLSELEEQGIIQGYTTFVDIQKMGLQFFKLSVHLQHFSSEKYDSLLSFCKSQPNVLHLIKALGPWELEVELEAQDITQIYAFIEELKTQFPLLIKRTEISIFKKEHKLEFLPNQF